MSSLLTAFPALLLVPELERLRLRTKLRQAEYSVERPFDRRRSLAIDGLGFALAETEASRRSRDLWTARDD